MKNFWSLGLLLATSPLHAAPEDFARGMTITIAEPGLAQRVTLTADLYEWVTRDDLGDLRIYDADGGELPYALRRPTAGESHTEWQALPLFPLPEPATGSETAAGVNIELGEGGAVVAVRGPVANAPGETGYLIDASGYPHQPAELALSWPAETPDFVARLQVEASDDLNSWRTLVAASTLAALHTDGQRVLLDRIELPPVQARYLRLRRLGGTDPLTLDSVRTRARIAIDPVRHWLSLTGTPKKAGTPNKDTYEFTANGRFPIDRIEATLERETFLIEARLYSRAGSKAPWQDLGTHRFYRARVNGRIAASEPLTSRHPNHHQWRVDLISPSNAIPKLQIGWLPDEVVFVPQGEQPYLLAYGRAGLTGKPWPIANLLSQLDADAFQRAGGSPEAVFDTLPVAQLASPRTLGGEARLQPEPQPVDWRTIILWTVLLVGVGLVALFAYRLLRPASSS
jgi:hypothetical protein